jgi:hypothetical protein
MAVGDGIGREDGGTPHDLARPSPAEGELPCEIGRPSALRLWLRWMRARTRRFFHRCFRLKHIRAAVGAAGVAVALALVGALVVAFGIGHRDPDPTPEDSGDTAAQLVTGAQPAVTQLKLSNNRDGLKVTLLRVERLGRGGRIYLRAMNGSGDRVGIPDSDIRLVQRFGRAAPAPDPRTGRLPAFPARLDPGGDGRSVRYFPRLRRGGAVVEVQWFSDNPRRAAKPITFSFQVT